jgi:transposase
LSRGDPTEAEWRILKMLLPVERDPGKRGRGRPPEDNRNIVNGILWRLRTGAPWRDVPEIGIRSIDVFDAGAHPVSGRAWPSLLPRRWRRAGTTTSTDVPPGSRATSRAQGSTDLRIGSRFCNGQKTVSGNLDLKSTIQPAPAIVYATPWGGDKKSKQGF